MVQPPPAPAAGPVFRYWPAIRPRPSRTILPARRLSAPGCRRADAIAALIIVVRTQGDIAMWHSRLASTVAVAIALMTIGALAPCSAQAQDAPPPGPYKAVAI